MSYTLELDKISKTFEQGNQKIDVLKEISLKIKKKEIVSLIGPSGSGKTTLLQIAGLLDNPSSGNVKINGKKVELKDDAARTEIRKNNIGFIYQFHHLIPELSVIENVALPLLIKDCKYKVAIEKAKHILQEVDLEDRINFMPSQLSGGQQQRVAIARAVITSPAIILADEPTGNLDSYLSEKIFRLLYDLVKNYELSCIIVTHNEKLACKADKIHSLIDGEIRNHQ